MHGDLALKMTADLFWTGLLVSLPVMAYASRALYFRAFPREPERGSGARGQA